MGFSVSLDCTFSLHIDLRGGPASDLQRGHSLAGHLHRLTSCSSLRVHPQHIALPGSHARTSLAPELSPNEPSVLLPQQDWSQGIPTGAQPGWLGDRHCQYFHTAPWGPYRHILQNALSPNNCRNGTFPSSKPVIIA